jgi:hypothetical protein
MILSSHSYILQSVENNYEITNDDDDDKHHHHHHHHQANMEFGHRLTRSSLTGLCLFNGLPWFVCLRVCSILVFSVKH